MKTLINWISFQLYFLHYNMDRQAFKQRMQQLKQYREQNPGKTYLDFKKYAEGGEIPPNNKPIIPEEPQPYSRQFKSFNKYTKWFNSIPLLSIGAAAVYNNNQEK